jgi:hypothetical protein
MLRKQSVASLLFLLASLLLLIPESGGAKEKARQRLMRFFGTVETADKLLLISGIVGPASFFHNLRSIDSPQGTVILNDFGEVQFFPQRMVITVHIVPINRKGASSRGLAPELMQGLRFRAEWKRGMKLRPVKEFRLLTASETKFPNFDPLGLFTYGWTYELILEDTDVPVSDHLILHVLSSEDKALARLSAYL